jgi:O-antigen/teichoic acid export membrane protein
MQIFFPVINKHYATKKLNLISELSKQVTKWTLIINMPLLVLMIIFPGSFINLLFGSEYLAATNSLRILAIGAFFSSISIVSYNLIAMTGKSKLLLMNTILSSALNVILCSIFIPLWGITGAASATALSFIFLSALLFFETKKNLKMIPYRRKSIRIAFSAIVPALIVMYFRDYARESLVTLAIAGIAYGLIYIGLIFLTQSLDSHDWDIIKAFKKKIESYTR